MSYIFLEVTAGQEERQEQFVLWESRATAIGRRTLEGRGNFQNCDSVFRSPTEPICIIWMETHELVLFLPISATVSV